MKDATQDVKNNENGKQYGVWVKFLVAKVWREMSGARSNLRRDESFAKVIHKKSKI